MDHADGSLEVLMGMILVLIEPSDMLEVVGHADGGVGGKTTTEAKPLPLLSNPSAPVQ